MIRAIDNKPLDLSDQEFEYYLSMIEAFGDQAFRDSFETNQEEGSPYYGFITLVTPPLDRPIPQGIVLFLMNCTINQRIREFEKKIELLNNKI